MNRRKDDKLLVAELDQGMVYCMEAIGAKRGHQRKQWALLEDSMASQIDGGMFEGGAERNNRENRAGIQLAEVKVKAP